MNQDRIKKVEEFLKEELAKSVQYEDNNQRSVEYRIEHSYRVANIALTIAKKEGLDQEKMVVACLLHDVGYAVEMKTKEDYRSHGRIGASIARPFLASLGYSEEDINEMCYGIAIHVDDKSDFEYERTPLALSIGDADNIDRFDAFRLYETLAMNDYKNLNLSDQKAFCEKYINGLTNFKSSYEPATQTAKELWIEKLDMQIEFYKKLLAQVEYSEKVVENE